MEQNIRESYEHLEQLRHANALDLVRAYEQANERAHANALELVRANERANASALLVEQERQRTIELGASADHTKRSFKMMSLLQPHPIYVCKGRHRTKKGSSRAIWLFPSCGCQHQTG
jgi:hypothetical protein